jgi:tRNA dimethylallyltransferase
LDVERDALNARINRRTRAMYETGLIEEVEQLLSSGIASDAPGMRAIGYPEAVEVVKGTLDRAEAIERVSTLTRRYAKRQRTWFRSERDAQWVTVEARSEDEKNLGKLEKTLAIA